MSSRRASPRTALALALTLGLLAGCGKADHPPPPPTVFEGLPVSGSLADAHRFGLTRCREDTTAMRCRRDGVSFLGFAPLNAAVDLDGSDGGGGFDQLILWHDRDQNVGILIGNALERQGWRACYTGEGQRGDQAIYTRPGTPVRVSMDLSYWGKRRLRLIPDWNNRDRRC